MNSLPETPLPEREAESTLQTWRRALTQPNEYTYTALAASPRAKATTAFLWIFIASLIQLVLVAIFQTQMPNLAQLYGLDADAPGFRSGIAAFLGSLLCGAPIGAAITTLFFAIWVAVVQWLAGMFGGRGTFDQLAYAAAAIGAPYSILAGVLILLSAIPYAGFCFSILLFFAGLYVLVLNVMAIKSVNQIGWGAAIGSLLIPGVVIAFVCACLTGLSIAALIPILRETAPNFTP